MGDRCRSITLAVAALVALTACGSSDESAAGSAPAETTAQSGDRALAGIVREPAPSVDAAAARISTAAVNTLRVAPNLMK